MVQSFLSTVSHVQPINGSPLFPVSHFHGLVAFCCCGGIASTLLGTMFSAITVVAAAPPTCAATLPYPEAVARTDAAARAVLARAGRESCLRGKLTNALLGLSNSCEKEARRQDPLCSLADRAVVVTPMSVAFMDETSRELLQLIAPGTPVSVAPGASRSSTAAAPSMAVDPTGVENP